MTEFEPAQREIFEKVPREERLQELANILEKPLHSALEILAQSCDLPQCQGFEIIPSATKVIPLRMMHEYQCLPVKLEEAERHDEKGSEKDNEDYLDLVTVWPPDSMMNRWVYAVCGRLPHWHLASPEVITNTITQKFGVGASSLDNSEMGMLEDELETQESEDENAAIITFVNEVIQKALADRATDIHFEPHKDALQIRYRIDGELVPVSVPENLIRFQGAIISRLKIMAKLNISERRRPQDGRIAFNIGHNELDIRISTFPIMYGESISLRLLNQKTQAFPVQDIGLLPDDEEIIRRVIQRPHGIILVTGPTGSGKSTSLTAFLRLINAPKRRIITVEDPIEYEVPGVNQTQVRSEIGLTFSAALRHILRQDPDVIMVGEIRDRETAEIAVRASLTGHLVFSTLHTNDAPGALTRLIDMEIEPFLIASSVELIIAQRLVRRICPQCAKPAQYEEGYLESCLKSLNINPAEAQNCGNILEPVGCEHCRQIGFRGRIGIFEILRMDEKIHELTVQKSSAHLIREQALKNGMRSLQICGWEQVKRGLTDIKEIMHFAEVGQEEV